MSRRPLVSILVSWIVAAALWLWLFLHLQVEWSLNSQYNYGWAVPFLALLIFWFRWQRRPEARSLDQNDSRAKWIGWILLLLLFPIRVVEDANPDWRLLSWLLALCVVGFSLVSLYRAGSRAWLIHFAFPVCLPLAAVPWPVRFENFLVQAMMRAVAAVAVEIASWFGVGAYQIGNVIQLRNGFVGVDEACSGVKTLQAGIMVALVLGELLQLTRKRRIALVTVGCGWVFVCNVFRATGLVFVGADSGLEVLARWHDWIGTAALVCGMAGMLVMAWLWKGEPQDVVQARPFSSSQTIFASPWIVLAWLALVFAGAEIWYRLHERGLIERPPWQVNWPAGNQTVAAQAIPDSTRVILRYDNAKSAVWEQPPGVHWWSFFAQWKPERAALELVRSHSPEICLPAIGRNFRRSQPDVNVRAGGVSLDFRSYEFEQNGRPLFVFVAIQDDKRAASPTADTGEWNFRGRLRAAWDGKRNLGQRLLEVAVLGLDDFNQAGDALSKTAQEILQPPQPTG